LKLQANQPIQKVAKAPNTSSLRATKIERRSLKIGLGLVPLTEVTTSASSTTMIAAITTRITSMTCSSAFVFNPKS